MSDPRRRRAPGRRPSRTRRPGSVDLWRPVARLPEPEPVVAVDDPTALVRSLGDPPLPGNRVAAGRYLASVIERAATLAAGLAAAANLPTEPDQSGSEV
jgi:hypothetical protein